MNQRNVEALQKLLDEWYTQSPLPRLRPQAEWLASRGVLVPSALTDEELIRLADLGEPDRMLPPDKRVYAAPMIRYELEGLAGGELTR